MSAPTIEIEVDFATTGVVDVASDSFLVTINRGQTDRLDRTIPAGSASIRLNNEDREYDPSNAAGSYFGELVPGRQVTVTAGGVVVFAGYVEDWNLEYDVGGRSVAELLSFDGLGLLARAEFDEWTSSATSASGKLGAICDRAEVAWDAGLRDFDTGLELMQSHTVSWGTNVLGYAQRVATTDQGYLFVAADGVLTFRDRLSRLATPTVIFGGTGDFTAPLLDDDGDPLLDDDSNPLTGPVDVVQYQEIAADIGSEVLFSRVGVDRDGGVKQTATVADLSAWQALYGPSRSYSISDTLLASDGRSLAVAEYLLGLYDEPTYRISTITVELAALDAAQQEEVLRLDITSVVTAKFTPNGVGSEIEQNLFVMGIRHEIAPMSHRVTFSVVPVFEGEGWDIDEWDSGEWG